MILDNGKGSVNSYGLSLRQQVTDPASEKGSKTETSLLGAQGHGAHIWWSITGLDSQGKYEEDNGM